MTSGASISESECEIDWKDCQTTPQAYQVDERDEEGEDGQAHEVEHGPQARPTRT